MLIFSGMRGSPSAGYHAASVRSEGWMKDEMNGILHKFPFSMLPAGSGLEGFLERR